MKKVLTIATVLTWFNLIVWGIFIAGSLLSSVVLGVYGLVSAFFICAIPLNCYAALKLHKSIRHPNIKLSHQTPVGIRFVGFVALFFGIMFITNAIAILQSPSVALEFSKELTQATPTHIQGMDKTALTVAQVRMVGGTVLFMGLAVVVNVVLNMRLLRWYYLVHQSDAS